MKNIHKLKNNLIWFSWKCFSFILSGIYFSKVVKKYLIICWLYQIWSSIFWFLYFFNPFYLFFSISYLWFNLIFISIFSFLFFSYHFLNWNFFIYQIWSLFFLLLFILFEIIYDIRFFKFHYLSSFLSVIFDLHSFYYYLFYLK